MIKKSNSVKINFKYLLPPALFLLNLMLMVSLVGCANSSVSREANSQVDQGYIRTSTAFNGSEFHPGEMYQNSSQTTKGIILGGATGALIGSATVMGAYTGAATGAILGGAFGSYLDHYTTLADKLENRHVKVFKLGDQMMIVIPSEQLFNSQTANIIPTSYSTLDLVAQLINSYKSESVRVTAFTDATLSKNVAYALTQEQANHIVRYLWRRGISTRMLYAVGAGGSQVMTESSAESDTSINYRVEITLERLPL